MGGMGTGPSRYYAGASCNENVQDGGERSTDDLCSYVHCLLEGLAVCCTTVPVPDSDTAGQHALKGSPVSRLSGHVKRCIFPHSELYE